MIDGLKRAGWSNVERSGTVGVAEMQIAAHERLAAANFKDVDWDLAWDDLVHGGMGITAGRNPDADSFDPDTIWAAHFLDLD